MKIMIFQELQLNLHIPLHYKQKYLFFHFHNVTFELKNPHITSF
jgi:hypothetical protein